jgi:RNA polymerase sigma-70 factor (ECF subfamily)
VARSRHAMHVVGVALPFFLLSPEFPGPTPARSADRRSTERALEPQKPGSAGDTLVVSAIRSGDPATFRALYTDFFTELADFALTITRSHDLAEDAVQLAMSRLWIARAHFAPATSIRGYLFTAVRRNALEILRRDRNITAAEAVAGKNVVHVAPSDESVEADERSRAAARAVAALPPRAREVFLLSRRFELSHYEIAAVLALSVNTIANHMGRALQGIALALREHSEKDFPSD